MNQATKPNRDYIEIFPNIGEFSAAINGRPTNPIFADDSRRASLTANEEFTATANFEEADNLLTHGYLKGAKKIQPTRAALKAIDAESGITRNPKLTRAPQGARVIVPLTLTGEPNNMLTKSRNPNRGRVINVYYNVAIDCSVKAKEIEEVNSRFLAAIAAAELAGIRVNLFAGVITSNNKRYFGFFANVKKSTAPLNLSLLAYSISHPSFLRRHYFRYMETTPANLPDDFWKGYGRPESKPQALFKRPDDSFCVSFYDIRNETPADTYKRLLEKER